MSYNRFMASFGIESVEPVEGARGSSIAAVSRGRLGLTFVALLLAFGTARESSACTCIDIGSTWASVARKAPVIVLGEVENNDGRVATLRVERALRGVVADRIEVTGDTCVPETHGIEVGSRLLMALHTTISPNRFWKESCRVTSLVAYGDRVFGRITGRRAHHDSPDYVFESLPIDDVLSLLESDSKATVCTDDGDYILSNPPGQFIPARPRSEISPLLHPDCISEVETLVNVRVLVDDRGRVARVRPVNDVPLCLVAAVRAGVHRAGFDPATSDGRPIASFYDVSVSLPASPSAPPCSRGARRQQLIIWSREGSRNVITTIVARRELNETALVALLDLKIEEIRIGDLIDGLDEQTAPQLVELRDNPPCEARSHRGPSNSFDREVIRVWKAVAAGGARLTYDSSDVPHQPRARTGRDEPRVRTKGDRRVAIRLSFESHHFEFDPALFKFRDADYVFIFLTRDGGVEPSEEQLIVPPFRPVVPSSAASDFVSIWNRYLAAKCREPRGVILEYHNYLQACGHCSVLNEGGRLREVGASWLSQPRSNLGFTRIRVVTGSSPQTPIRWKISSPRASLPGTQIIARHDAVDVGSCEKGLSYRRSEQSRRDAEIQALNSLFR